MIISFVAFVSITLSHGCTANMELRELKNTISRSYPEKPNKFDGIYRDKRRCRIQGFPVPIVLASGKHSFDLDESALQRILLQKHVKEKNVVVISVAGAFRKGKSFLLDFFLRYLNSEGCDGWMGEEDSPLEGFSWRGGSERDTTGILFWSEPFLRKLPTGEEVAVLLMDTQGTFDSESTVRDCATIFALSTMTSSVQIYNLLHNIQEDDLQHLQLFTEYGRLALKDCNDKPFQKLQFLIRDWSFPYEADYGDVGGNSILQRRLEVSEKQHPELQSVREHIRSCFKTISCFLMPHPGLKVATNPEFNGKLSDIETDFKNCLEIFAPMVLSSENLVIKEIGGQKVKAKELLQYFKSYVNIYKGDELPEPKTMLVATAEGNNLAAVGAAKDTYKSMMEIVCGGTQPYISTTNLDAEHTRVKKIAIRQFREKRKMGGEEFSRKFEDSLVDAIEDMFIHFKASNENKNIFKSSKTPAVYIAVSVVFYLASAIFGLIGVYSLANICNFIMGSALLILVLWSYVKYSGEMRELGVQIDEMAAFMWENLIKQICRHFLQKSAERLAVKAMSESKDKFKRL